MAKNDKEDERKFILECIELYRALPALWKVKSAEYADRRKKGLAYERLLAKYRERYESATKEDVKRKFNALRTNFRKEIKKVVESGKSGDDPDDLYESSLWYYDAMLFLQDQDTPALSRRSMDVEVEGSADGDSTNECVETTDVRPQDNLPSGAAQPFTRKRKMGVVETSDELMTLACKRLREQEDEHVNLVKVWIHELMQMEPQQQLLAKKAINDILFEGRMGTLHRHSVQINTIPPQSYEQYGYTQPIDYTANSLRRNSAEELQVFKCVPHVQEAQRN